MKANTNQYILLKTVITSGFNKIGNDYNGIEKYAKQHPCKDLEAWIGYQLLRIGTRLVAEQRLQEIGEYQYSYVMDKVQELGEPLKDSHIKTAIKKIVRELKAEYKN